MLSLDALTQAVQQTKTVEQSAITLITGLAQKIADLSAQIANGTDPATVQPQLDDFAAQLNEGATALAAAITATPSTPAA